MFIPILLSFYLTACWNASSVPEQPDIQSRITQDLNKLPEIMDHFNVDTSILPKTKYISDKAHSSISFRTKHWEIVDIIGWFEDFQVIMYSDSTDFSDAAVFATVDPLSIRMPNLKMAGTASQNPYIDSEKWPAMTFVSKAMMKTGSTSYELLGDITINGIGLPIVFEVFFNGFAYPGEKSICGFDVRGVIKRQDFHVGIEDRLHSGRQVHADSIHLFLSLRME